MVNSTRRSKSIASCGGRVKKIKLEATDQISTLPDDCLTGIFSHLNHVDVDEISLVSKRMLAATLAAERMRWRARKIPAYRATVSQVNSRRFLFTLEYEKIEIKRTVSSTITNIADRLFQLEGKVNFRNVNFESDLDKVLIILNRFNFTSFIFESITLDEDFIRFFIRITSSHTIRTLTFRGDSVDVANLNEESKQRFQSSILDVKPKFFRFECNETFLDVIFLRTFALTNPGSSVVDSGYRASVLQCDEESANAISNYIGFRVPMIINTDLICEQIAKRLMLKQRGTGHMLINRNLTVDDIQTFIREKNFVYDLDHKILRIANTGYYVSIWTTLEGPINDSTYFISCNFDCH